MTKLTQQEIEKERRDFDSWMSVRYDGMADLRFMISEYKSIQVNNHWKAWLARAELTKPKKHKFLPLTDKQLNVLSYIEQYINEKGYSPRLKEVQKALDFKSENSISAIVKNLINKGYLVKRTGWRGLELTKGSE